MDAKEIKADPMEKGDDGAGERNPGAGLYVVSGCSIVLSAACIGCLIPWFLSKPNHPSRISHLISLLPLLRNRYQRPPSHSS